MSRRFLALTTLGITAYLLFLAATIPATLVAEIVRTGSNAMVQLTDARGTLWNGNARAVISPARSAPIAIDALAWRWRPARLLAGEIAFIATASSGSLAAELEAARGFGGWALRDVTARGDAARFATLVPIVSTWQPAGAITAASPSLAWDGKSLAGEITAEWRNAVTVLSDVRPLGSYKAELKAAGDSARISVTTLQGPLRIQGTGTWGIPDRISFQGEARGEGERASALDPLLDLLGPRRADGARTIEWRAP